LTSEMQTMTFPGTFESLDKIRDFVVQAARQAGFDESATYAVELSVDEACTNIIEHAYGGEGRGELDCSVEITDQDLIIVLHDEGEPFDPDNIPIPNHSVPLEELKPRGVGLFLIRKMMDEIRFEFTPDRGNILTMVKHRKPATV
jgi:serine/threonine-protein kinase RsbW